jgi:hypothetical protein
LTIRCSLMGNNFEMLDDGSHSNRSVLSRKRIRESQETGTGKVSIYIWSLCAGVKLCWILYFAGCRVMIAIHSKRSWQWFSPDMWLTEGSPIFHTIRWDQDGGILEEHFDISEIYWDNSRISVERRKEYPSVISRQSFRIFVQVCWRFYMGCSQIVISKFVHISTTIPVNLIAKGIASYSRNLRLGICYVRHKYICSENGSAEFHT